MGFSPKPGFCVVVALVVVSSEIFATAELQIQNTTLMSNDSPPPPSALLNSTYAGVSQNTTRLENTILTANNSTEGGVLSKANKRTLRKNWRRRRRGNRKRRIDVPTSSFTTPSPAQLDQSKLSSSMANFPNRKRKRKNKRRKNKKQRKKQRQQHNNILEITTGREGLISRNTSSNSTIGMGELIRKLNDNPEDNFEGFHLKQENRTLVLNNVANLVAPVPAADRHVPIPLNNNITLHVSVSNGTKHKLPSRKYNRCRKNKGGCAHYCNPRGKVKCSCIKGFFLAQDQKTCLDVDECKSNNGGCEQTCSNTLGSFECRCASGLAIRDDKRSCQDINECLLRNGHGPCQDTCENSYGSYSCSCVNLNGTQLGEDGRSCVDLDECARNNGGCSHECINTVGRAFCRCPDGMELSSDWRTCQDINECEDQDIQKYCKVCVNTEGSYHCADFSGYQNDQTSTTMVCKPLFPPLRGFISCSRDGASVSYTKTGRRRIVNSPGTSCLLVCPTGYKMVGRYHVTCGWNGRWDGTADAKCIRAEPPKLECPPSQVFTTDREAGSTSVTFPSPKTNINWKYVKSYPFWAKDLTGVLKIGQYDIHFTVRDPSTKLTASCSFKIVVE